MSEKNPKIGDIINKDMLNGLLKAPIKVVKITYTYEDKHGTTMDLSATDKAFQEKQDKEKDDD